MENFLILLLDFLNLSQQPHLFINIFAKVRINQRQTKKHPHSSFTNYHCWAIPLSMFCIEVGEL